MKTKSVKTILASIILSLAATGTASAMKTLDGQQTSISRFTGNGKWLVVQAWKSDCALCNKSVPEMARTAHTFPNARVLGVSLDNNIHATRSFMRKHKVKFPTIRASVREFNSYLKRVAGEPLTGTPTYLIFSPQGQLQAMQPGMISTGSIYNFLSKQ